MSDVYAPRPAWRSGRSCSPLVRRARGRNTSAARRCRGREPWLIPCRSSRETLDPALSTGSSEFWVIPALLEGLTQYHPAHRNRWPRWRPTMKPPPTRAASPSTSGAIRLREGPRCPAPKRFPRSSHEVAEPAPDRRSRALERRPRPSLRMILCIRGGDCSTQKRPRRWLTSCTMSCTLRRSIPGSAASKNSGFALLDDFTFRVDLRSPTPFFLHLITQYIFQSRSPPGDRSGAAGRQRVRMDSTGTHGEQRPVSAEGVAALRAHHSRAESHVLRLRDGRNRRTPIRAGGETVPRW